MKRDDAFTSEPVLVYKITCSVTKKLYIGITRKTLSVRLKQHLKESRANRFQTVLYRSIRAHGEESFQIELLYEAVDGREAQMVERGLISSYATLAPNGMNTSTGGEAHAGRACTQEVRDKISKSKKGKSVHSAESKRRMGEKRRGVKRPEVSVKLKAWFADPENKAKWAAANALANPPESYSRKGTAAMTKLWATPGFREKRADDLANLNARKTANKKPKVTGRGKHGAMLARWQGPEYRAMMLSKQNSEERKEKARAVRVASNKARTGKKMPPHVAALRSEIAQKHWADPVARARHLEGIRHASEARKLGAATAAVRAMARELPVEIVARATR